ncbi:MAG: glutamine--fructose-6-phosphate transaminase (isomerizing) [Actinomycetota bacterium]
MCGIVGYIGKKESAPLLLEGLKRLEYRGYDSAGLAVVNDGKISLVRRAGCLSELDKALKKGLPKGVLGVGHTRWATHGAPTEKNAHPHLDCRGKIALVHNGIIENFLALRERLTRRGHIFSSETDTETLVHLIEDHYKGDLEQAVRDALKEVEGSFAIAVVSTDQPDRMVAARKESPLIMGIGKGEYIIASDIPAVLPYTRDILILEDGDLVSMSRDGYRLTNLDDQEVQREIVHVTWDAQAAEKSGYDDFMLKEIYEQPMAIRETLRGRFYGKGLVLDELKLAAKDIKSIDKVFVVACGTSYHAGLVAKYAIESWTRIPVEIDIASEFRYRDPILDKKTLMIAVSQSGETADTLAGVRYAREQGAKVMAITNVVGSTISREADGVLYTHAGPEIGVAATKTLIAQMIALYLLTLYLARVRRSLAEEDSQDILTELRRLDRLVTEILMDEEEMAAIKAYAESHAACPDFLFIGRSVGFPVALEGALKLKEISYIHAEGYAGGELKHGPIALVEEGVPVVAVTTAGHVYDKIVSNIQEVKARGADVLAVATRGDKNIENHADSIIYVPRTSEILSAVPAIVPLQLIAYYIAKKRGCNVDQPRNLAKSVTVE